MKRVTINRDKSALAEAPVEQLTARSDPPAMHHRQRIVLAIAGQRYEVTLHTEVRQITRGPAKVVEMPASVGGDKESTDWFKLFDRELAVIAQALGKGA